MITKRNPLMSLRRRFGRAQMQAWSTWESGLRGNVNNFRREGMPETLPAYIRQLRRADRLSQIIKAISP